MRRRTRQAVVFILLGAASAGWLWRGKPALERGLRPRVESALTRLSGHPLRVGALRIHPLFFSLRLTDLRWGEGSSPLFTCRSWSLRPSFAETGPTGVGWRLALVSSRIEHPVVRIPPSGSSRPLDLGPLFRLPYHRLTWSGGVVDLSSNGTHPAFHLRESRGVFWSGGASAAVSLSGESPWGPLRAQGRVSRSALDPGWRFSVDVDPASLDSLSPWIPPGRREAWGAWAGRASLAVKAEGRRWGADGRPLWEGGDWSVGARFLDASWRPVDRPEAAPLALSGEALLSPSELTLRGLRIGRSLVLDGACREPFSPERRYHLTAKAQGLRWEELSATGLSDYLGGPAAGELDVDLTWRGRSPWPRGTLAWRGLRGLGLAWPDGEGRVAEQGEVLRADADWAGGKISISGPAPSDATEEGGASSWWRFPREPAPSLPSVPTVRGSTVPWTIQAWGMDLGMFARVNGWPAVGGTLSGQGRLEREISRGSPWRFRGGYRLQNLQWGLRREVAPVGASLTFDGDRWLLTGEAGGFRAEVVRSTAGWVLREMAYRAEGGLRVEAAGVAGGPGGTLDLRGRVRGLPLSGIPPLRSRWPNVAGSANLSVDLSGTWAAPRADVSATVEDLRVRPDGRSHGGTGEGRWTREGWTLSRVVWDDALVASGSWTSRAGWSWRADLGDSDAASWADLWTSSASGRVRGVWTCAQTRPRGPWRGEASVRWDQGQLGAIKFQEFRVAADWEGGRWRVWDGVLRQETGGAWVRAEGEREAGGPGRWILSGRLDDLRVGAVTTRGSWSGRGQWDADGLEGVLRSTDLAAGGVRFGDVRGRVVGDGRRWRWEDWTNGAGLTGRMSLDDRRWSGEVSARDWALADRVSGWPVGVAPGRLTGRVAWEGPRTAPSATADARWEGSIAGIPAVGRCIGVAAGGEVQISTVDVALAGGGRAVLSGRWSSDGLDARARLEDFPVAVPLSWATNAATEAEGRLNGAFRATGTLGSPVVTGRILGEDLRWRNRGPARAEARGRWADGTLTWTGGEIVTPDGRWRVEAGATLERSGPSRYRWTAKNDLRNISLGPLTLFGGLSTFVEWGGGPAGFLTGEGTARLGAEGLWVNQHRFDQELARVTFRGRRFDFRSAPGAPQALAGGVDFSAWPQVRFDNLSLADRGARHLWLEGEAGPSRWDFRLQGWGLEAETLLALGDITLPIGGLWDARLEGTGTGEHPRLAIEIDGRRGRAARVPYDRLEARADWSEGRLHLQRLVLARKKGYLLTGEGDFPLGRTGALPSYRFQLRNGDLAILSDVWTDCQSARGAFQGELSVTPGPEGAETTGFFSLINGEINARRYVERVSRLTAEGRLRGDRFTVETLTGKVGRGRLVVAGSLGLSGVTPTDYDLTIQTPGEPGIDINVPELSVPPGPILGRLSFLQGVSQGRPRVDLRVTGPHGQHRVAGTLILDRTQFTYPPSKYAVRSLGGWFGEFLKDTEWDILFRTGDDTWYRNEYVSAQIDGGLRLTGRRGHLQATGRVDTRRGVIFYLGQSFDVTRGVFELVVDTPTLASPGTGPTEGKVTPYLAGEAQRSVTTLDNRGYSTEDVITMSVDRAPLGEIQPRFVSRNNPGLASERVAQRTLGQVGSEPLNPDQRDQLLRAGLVQLLGQSAGPLVGRLAHRFGIVMLYPIYEPDESSSPNANPNVPADTNASKDLMDYLRGAGVFTGVRLSSRLFGVYKFKVDKSEPLNQFYLRDEVEVIYRLAGSLHLRASTELVKEEILGEPPNRQAMLEQRWRFGGPRRRSAAPRRTTETRP